MGPDPLLINLTHFATVIYGYKNHAIWIIQCVYSSNNMADSWPLPVNTESMEKFYS